MSWGALEAMILTWLVPALWSLVLFLAWEPWKKRQERLRAIEYAKSNPHIDVGICYREVNWPGGGVFIEHVYVEKWLRERIVLRSYLDGSRTVLTGRELLEAVPTTQAHPEDPMKTLIFFAREPDNKLLPPAAIKKLQALLARDGFKRTIWGEYKQPAKRKSKIATRIANARKT